MTKTTSIEPINQDNWSVGFCEWIIALVQLKMDFKSASKHASWTENLRFKSVRFFEF